MHITVVYADTPEGNVDDYTTNLGSSQVVLSVKE